MDKHKHGGDVYSGDYQVDFSANINPLGVPDAVIQAVQDSTAYIQQYPDVACRRLRDKLAAAEGLKAEQLIFGNGAAELIFALTLGVRPQRAVLAVPGFAEYEEALKASGCEITYYRRNRKFEIEEDYFSYLTDQTDMIFLCNPNNPTGNLLERPFLDKVLKICAEKEIIMVVDECFLGFLEESESHSMKMYIEQYPNLFILSAFTKLYAMPGLRLGYGISGNPQLIAKMAAVMQPWSVSVPAQLAGVAALDEIGYVKETRLLIAAERDYLEQQLDKLGLMVYPGAVNYIFFWGPQDLAERCRERGILIRDCSNYTGLEPGYFRIAVRLRIENDKLLEVLSDVIKETGKWQK